MSLLHISILLSIATLAQALLPILWPLHIQRSYSKRHLPRVFALGKARNKQAELVQKMEEAKRQQRGGSENKGDKQNEGPDEAANDQNRLDNERAEFAALLAKFAPRREPNDADDIPDRGATVKRKVDAEAPPSRLAGGPKTVVKRRKKIAQVSQTDMSEEEDAVLVEGDVAKRRHFEPLVCPTTQLPLGPMIAAQLVPWVPPYLSRSLIVLADPRKRSSELKAAIVSLLSFAQEAATLGMPPCTIVAITSDTPEEVAGWLKRIENGDRTVIRVFSDVHMEWMKLYSADVGRWALTFYAIDDDGVLQRLVREVEPSQCPRLVSEYLQTMVVK